MRIEIQDGKATALSEEGNGCPNSIELPEEIANQIAARAISTGTIDETIILSTAHLTAKFYIWGMDKNKLRALYSNGTLKVDNRLGEIIILIDTKAGIILRCEIPHQKVNGFQKPNPFTEEKPSARSITALFAYLAHESDSPDIASPYFTIVTPQNTYKSLTSGEIKALPPEAKAAIRQTAEQLQNSGSNSKYKLTTDVWIDMQKYLRDQL